MTTQIDFNSILKDGGERYLHNQKQENLLGAQLERLEGTYKAIRDLLERTDLPANPDYIKRVAREGRDGLEAVVREMTEKTIKRLAVPGYLAESFRQSAPGNIPGESYRDADTLRTRIANDEDGLPIEPGDFVFREDTILDTEAILARIRQGCRIRITPEMEAEADKVLQLAKELRALELTGLNGIELATRYARAGDTPAPSSLYRDLIFRRHAPGRMDNGMDFVFNEVGLRGPAMNPLK